MIFVFFNCFCFVKNFDCDFHIFENLFRLVWTIWIFRWTFSMQAMRLNSKRCLQLMCGLSDGMSKLPSLTFECLTFVQNLQSQLICLFSVPPEQPQIYSEQVGMIIDRVGPLVEGTDLTLICLVRGGYPSPEITWMSRERKLPGVMVELNFHATLNSKLVIKNLSRVHQLAVYSCHASNYPRMSVSANVTIELTRKYGV